MTKLPSKFQIRTKHDDITRYMLTLSEATGKYACRNVTSLDSAYDLLVTYSPKSVQEFINEGDWIITKSLDEPELKFPFTVLHKDYLDHPERLYTITKGNGDRVNLSCWDGEIDHDFCTEEQCKNFIKEGTWLVKHVGEKAEENTQQEPPQATESAPQSRTVSTLKVDVECNTGAAVEAVENLTAVYENLALAMQRVIRLQKEMRNV